MEIIAAGGIRNRKIKEEVLSFALGVDEASWKATDCQQGEAKRSYRGFVAVGNTHHYYAFFFFQFCLEEQVFLFGRCPNRVIEIACFDSKLQ